MPDEANIRSEWKNNSPGVIGVVVYDDRGQRGGVGVRPGDTVWLTEPERIATANAPRNAKDNPFANGSLVLATRASEVKNRRPFGDAESPVEAEVNGTPAEPEEGIREERPPSEEEVGAPPLPEGDPERGSRPPGEEVGNPEVVARAGTQKRAAVKTRGTTVRSDNPAAKPAPKPGTPVGVVAGVGGVRYAEATDAAR
jgi:hypothetical protein